jgi:hypothetical protein
VSAGNGLANAQAWPAQPCFPQQLPRAMQGPGSLPRQHTATVCWALPTACHGLATHTLHIVLVVGGNAAACAPHACDEHASCRVEALPLGHAHADVASQVPGADRVVLQEDLRVSEAHAQHRRPQLRQHGRRWRGALSRAGMCERGHPGRRGACEGGTLGGGARA